MFGIKDLIQQAQGLQTKVAELQESLAERTVTGTAGGDMVTIVATGAQEIISIKIEPDVLASGDVELLEDLILAATNDALKKSRDLAAEEMSKLTGGLKIPGLV